VLARLVLAQRRRLAFTAALLAAAAVFAPCARSHAAPGQTQGSQLPLREGNIYDHQEHQPTPAEERAAGVPPISATTKHEVEQEVKRLLQQTDRLDKQSEEEVQGVGRGKLVLRRLLALEAHHGGA
jgi:hypothetical protein